MGDAVLSLSLVQTDRAREFVPAELAIVRFAPGRTLGGVYLAAYTKGSVLEYRELVVIPGVVRLGYSIGAWISHIYVDHEQSRAGGRNIWGLPKELAQFEWHDQTQAVVVRDGNGVLCTFRCTTPRLLAPMPLLFPALSRRDQRFWAFHVRGSARIGLSSSHGIVEVPATRPFSALRLGKGVAVHLKRLDVRVHPPAAIGR